MPCALVIGRDEELKFGDLVGIYVDGLSVIFEVIPMHTVHFYHHYHAFALGMPHGSANTRTYLVNYHKILDYHPYGLYHSSCIDDPTLKYVVLKSSIYAQSS